MPPGLSKAVTESSIGVLTPHPRLRRGKVRSPGMVLGASAMCRKPQANARDGWFRQAGTKTKRPRREQGERGGANSSDAPSLKGFGKGTM